MKNAIFEWNDSSWEEVNRSTILNGFRVSFDEDRDFPQIEENEMKVNETGLNTTELVELLECFSIIDDENCGGLKSNCVNK